LASFFLLFVFFSLFAWFETFPTDNKMLFRTVNSLAPTAQAASRRLASLGSSRSKHTLVLVRHGACQSGNSNF
jgi:hypothetical protein